MIDIGCPKLNETVNYQAINSIKGFDPLIDLDKAFLGQDCLITLKGQAENKVALNDSTSLTKGGNLLVKKVLVYIFSIAFFAFALYKIIEMKK